jgi:hypothetical protein
MPPRKHVAKSQEFVYKKVGRGSLGGSRQKFKLVAQDIPSNGGSTSTPDAEAPPQLPPVVSAPTGDEGTSDVPSFDDHYEYRPKKSGKVCL